MNYNGAMNFKWENVSLVADLFFFGGLASSGAYLGFRENMCAPFRLQRGEEEPARMRESQKQSKTRRHNITQDF